MTVVPVSPQVVAGAAQSVAGIGSTLQQAHTLAGPATTAVVAAAGDQVSAAEAALYSSHGQVFQAASAQAARFHAEFAQALGAAGGAYAAAEAAAMMRWADALVVCHVEVESRGTWRFDW